MGCETEKGYLACKRCGEKYTCPMSDYRNVYDGWD